MKRSRGTSRIIDVYHGVPQDVSIVCFVSYDAHGYTNAATTRIMYIHIYPCIEHALIDEGVRGYTQLHERVSSHAKFHPTQQPIL